MSEGVRESFWRQGMLGGSKGQYDCIKQFSEGEGLTIEELCEVV